MSAADPFGERGGEHAIDLGRTEHAAIPPPPEPPLPGRIRRVPNAALAYAAILIALAAAVVAVVKWDPLHRTLAETTVTAFLEAVRAGDVALALSYTEDPDLTGDFLVREALDPRWSVVTVAQVEYRASKGVPGRFVAQVYAEIEAYEGTRLGYRYQVGIEDGRARIENGFFRSAAYAAFGRIDVNRVSVPVEPELGTTTVTLLPGLYLFYPDLPSTMEFTEPATALALGDQFKQLGADRSEQWFPIPWPRLSAEGEELVDAAVRDYYDACAADPAIGRCPFAFPEDPARDLAFAPGASWEIASYPGIDAGQLWYEQERGFGLITAMYGEARARVVVTEGGRERETTVSCLFWVEGLYAALDFEGGVAIGPGPIPTQESCWTLTEVV